MDTMAVVQGQKRGSPERMGSQEAIDLNVPAIHVSPVKSREMIKQAAQSCLAKISSVERSWVEPAYEMVRISSPDERGVVRQAINRADDFIELITQPPQYEDLPNPMDASHSEAGQV